MNRNTDLTRREFVQLGAAAGAWLAAGGTAGAAEQAPALRAGAARKDITPTKPVMLAGYGSRKDLSKGIHDPLAARAVAFEQGGRRLVLVSADFLGFYGGTAVSIRKTILEACGLQPSELFLAAIHTHSAPTPTLGRGRRQPDDDDEWTQHAANVEWTKMLESQLLAAVREALAGLTPAEVAIACGSSPVGVNRREPVPHAPGKPAVQLGRNPAGPTDPEVQMLRVSRAGTADGQPAAPLAVVFAYATHSTALGPHNYLVSGDVHGLAEQFVERQLGGGVVAAGFAGASGDIDPWFRVLPGFNTTSGWIPEPVLLGTMLGEEVVHVLGHGKRTVPRAAPGGAIPPASKEKPASGGPIQTAFQALRLPEKEGPRGESPERKLGLCPEFNLTVGRLGDVGVVGLGGEVFNEIGKAIKAASPFPHTLIITHCNGTAGYLPTKESYPDGGYGVDNSPFGPAAAKQVVEEAVRMLRGLRSADPQPTP
jgi:hypothetical protein